jgi:DNA/RNA-binding domain of Phe-tRNA-synthetase-like protein
VKITIDKKSEIVAKQFLELETYLKTKFKDNPPSRNEIVSNVRRMYRRIGWEPTKYRPSSEAMIRRILKGIGLYRINNLVDLGNVTSARFHLPMGLYDFNKIEGNIIIDVGKEGESYQGISKEKIHGTGKMVLRDDVGIFGNPTADSKRTSLTEKSNTVLAIFFTPPEVTQLYLKQTLDFLETLYLQECPQSEFYQSIIT